MNKEVDIDCNKRYNKSRGLTVAFIFVKRHTLHKYAEVAELADAHGSGPCDSNIMRVQVPSSAQIQYLFVKRVQRFLFSVLFLKQGRHSFVSFVKEHGDA